MLAIGIINTTEPKKLSPAIIKDGIIFSYDFHNKVIRGEKLLKDSFVVFRLVEDQYAIAWWEENLDIAIKWSDKWSEGLSNDKPKYDLRSLKQIPSKSLMEWTKPKPDLR